MSLRLRLAVVVSGLALTPACGASEPERTDVAPASAGSERALGLTSDRVTMSWPGEPHGEEQEVPGLGIMRTYSVVTDGLRFLAVISPRTGSVEEELEGSLMSIAISELGPRVTSSESRPTFSRLAVPSQGVTARMADGAIYQDTYVLDDATLIVMLMVLDGSQLLPPDGQTFLSSVVAH